MSPISYRQFVFVALIFMVLTTGALLTSCEIKRPGVSNNSSYSLLKFNHNGFASGCIACHEEKRPAPMPAPTWAPVAEFLHYDNQDCNTCHSAGGSWTSHSFNHSPTPLTCYQCHESDRSAPVAGHQHGAQGDCKSCHSVASTWATSVSKFTHTEGLNSCTSCHEKDRPPTYNKNGKILSHNMNADCITCHKPGAWIPATAFDHTTTTQSCSSCHGAGMSNDKTTASMHNGMTHPPTGECSSCHITSGFTPANSFGAHTGVTTNCASCHTIAGVYVTSSTNALPSKMTLANNESHPTSASGDCSLCHNFSSGPLKGHAFDYKHEPRPISCISCHEAGSNIVVTTGSLKKTRPASHTSSPDVTKKTGDCISCHTSTSSWAVDGGDIAANHATYLTNNTSCSSCHASGNPTPRQKPSQFSVDGTAGGKKVNHDSTNECKLCHAFTDGWYKASRYDHTQSDWAANSVTCNDCHSGAGIALPANKNPSQIRTTSTVPHPNSTTCSACHNYGGVGTGWRGLSTNYNHGPAAPSSCTLCHDSQKITTNTNETKRPTNMTLYLSVGTLHPTNTVCNTCHTMPTTGHTVPMAANDFSWRPATSMDHNFLKGPTVTSGQATLYCTGCHESGADSNYVSNSNNKRPATMGSTRVTNSYASGHYNISKVTGKPTDCYGCHSTSGLWNNFVGGATHKARMKSISGYVNTSLPPLNGGINRFVKSNCTTSCH
jgi:hypothetical protein